MSPPPARSRIWGLVIVAAAAAIGAGFYLTAPKPERRSSKPHRPLVTVETLKRVSYKIELDVHGRAEPLTRIGLVPEVAGRIVKVHPSFVPGGRVPANQPIVRIDARGYVAAVQVAEANLKTAEEELRLEEGRHRAALEEWKQFGATAGGSEDEKDLATRGPQRRMQEAAVEKAKATLFSVRLDLERCSIRLPYDAVIESVNAAPGSLAQPGQSVGAAYPVGAFWVRATLPVDRLRWVEGGPAKATLFPRGAAEPIEGLVREISPSVQERGSLGQVLVEVPLGTDHDAGRLPVRAGEFVRVVLPGTALEDVFVLPRSALHAGGEVWLARPDDTLEIRRVTPFYSARDVVIVREGLSDGERLITSQLSQPVHGMSIRAAEEEPTSS